MAPPPDVTSTRRLGRGMGAAAAVLLIGLLWLFFNDTLERRAHPNRDIAVAPGSGQSLVLQRNRAGHYLVPGTINGEPVVFLLDTGATRVSVPAELGSRLGLRPGAPASVQTANGSVTVRDTRIDQLALGPFVLRDVHAQLNPGMGGDQVLLGMNVLRQLEFTQQGDTLTLRLPR